MTQYLQFKAGPAVIDMIRDEGLRPERIRVFAAPAGGPKWFVSVGFDQALMKSRFLGQGNHRVLLAGASAGAWRCITMACREPLNAYEKLCVAYSRNVFTAADTPGTLKAALEKNIQSFLSDNDIPFILEHPSFDLVVHTVRGARMRGSQNGAVQGAALILGALLNTASRKGMKVFFERVIFFSGSEQPLFMSRSFNGSSVRLDSENLRLAALATGCLPLIIKGVTDIPGAPEGVYMDGGLLDYQLNQDYCPTESGVTLFFHYQERIIPGWFDKHLSWRRPEKEVLERIVQVYPSEDFVSLLPGGRIPDRSDFKTFVNNPSERIRRWDEAAKTSMILGEEFMEALDSRLISKRIQRL